MSSTLIYKSEQNQYDPSIQDILTVFPKNNEGIDGDHVIVKIDNIHYYCRKIGNKWIKFREDTIPTSFGNAGLDYTEFEADGTLKMHGKSTVYDDIQVALSGAKVPAANAPTWRTHDFGVGGGVAYSVLGFDIGDYLDFYVQTSHAMKLNSILDNHVHGTIPIDSANDKIQWQLDVVGAPIGGTWAVVTGSPFTKEFTLAGSEADKHNMLDIADIPAINTTISTIYLCRLTRIAASADDYEEEVYLIFNDCHYQADTLGSRTEGSK